jgi:hypothetical protein
MELLLIVLSITLSIAGCHILNDNGSFSNNNKVRLTASATHFAAIALLGASYGGVRGFFIYLGLLSFIGMTYSLVSYTKAPRQK